jgi:hypothetical protein
MLRYPAGMLRDLACLSRVRKQERNTAQAKQLAPHNVGQAV